MGISYKNTAGIVSEGCALGKEQELTAGCDLPGRCTVSGGSSPAAGLFRASIEDKTLLAASGAQTKNPAPAGTLSCLAQPRPHMPVISEAFLCSFQPWLRQP